MGMSERAYVYVCKCEFVRMIKRVHVYLYVSMYMLMYIICICIYIYICAYVCRMAATVYLCN